MLNSKIIDPKTTIANLQEQISKHICDSFTQDDIKENIFDYRKNSLVFLNEYLFSPENFELLPSTEVEHIMPESGKNINNYDNDKWTKDDIDKNSEKAADRIVNFLFESC